MSAVLLHEILGQQHFIIEILQHITVAVKIMSLVVNHKAAIVYLLIAQVSCGGCHTLVIARPRPESDTLPVNGDGMQQSAEESVSSDKLSAVSEMIRRGELSASLDMSGSISARIRRRQKMPVMMLLVLTDYY